ncbi:TIM29 translocase, partial [Neodrepanis coruscans]|nr:TIM29 translocase [Neodrepanis coruscans]
GVVAVAREEPHGRDPALYSALCPHLRPRGWFGEGASLLLDVGVLGRWWVLEWALRDCDVNEEELGGLPLDPRELRSER